MFRRITKCSILWTEVIGDFGILKREATLGLLDLHLELAIKAMANIKAVICRRTSLYPPVLVAKTLIQGLKLLSWQQRGTVLTCHSSFQFTDIPNYDYLVGKWD